MRWLFCKIFGHRRGEIYTAQGDEWVYCSRCDWWRNLSVRRFQ